MPYLTGHKAIGAWEGILVRRFRIHLSYANVMATVAVFVALGGSSYAAFSLPKNSVGSRQLKNHAVTPKKVAASTVALFKGRKGDRGPAGPIGLAGIQGARGSQGPIGPSNSYYAAGSEFVPTSESVPAGDYAVSGDASVGCSAACGISCRIQLNGKDAGPSASAATAPSASGELNVADSASLHLSSSGTIGNACSFDSGIGTFISRNVMAIKVGSASP